MSSQDFEGMANDFAEKAIGFMDEYTLNQKIEVMREDWEDGLQEEVLMDFNQWDDYLDNLIGSEMAVAA
jgi:hypothetical protein